MTGYETPPSVWRIRVRRLPTGPEFDEYDVRRFLVGDVYDVPARLGLLMILNGSAELADQSRFRDVAADHSRRTPRKRR